MTSARSIPVRLTHETLTLKREFSATPDRVFAAYADVTQRVRWSNPSDTTAIVYSREEFRAGGVDEFRCGSKGALEYEGVVRYVSIAPPGLIIYTEVISSEAMVLGASLISWEIVTTKKGARLTVTDQVASLQGSRLIDGSRLGMNAALDHLVEMLKSGDSRGFQ